MEIITPKIESASVTFDKLTILFTHVLDKSVSIPLQFLSVNSGQVPILSAAYKADGGGIDLILSAASGGMYFSYTPVDLYLGLRSVIPSGSSEIQVRVAAVKNIENYPVERLSEDVTGIHPEPSLGSTSSAPTVGDFVSAYTRKEAIELSNLSDGSAGSINERRIEMALEDASSYIDNYLLSATAAGIRLISSNRRRTTLTIARYYLDTVRRRETVTQDYDNAIKELQISSSATGGGAIDPVTGTRTTFFRSHRVPQVYNRETRKGFHSWDRDPLH